MKKQFKAPTIELRRLAAEDAVMADGQLGILANSMNAARNGVGITDTKVTQSYSSWQGFNSTN